MARFPPKMPALTGPERLKKYCSHPAGVKTEAVFLGFGFVSAQLQGCFEPAPSPKPRQNPNILAPNGHNISLKALKILFWLGDLQICRAAGAGVRCHAGSEFGGVYGHGLIRHFQGSGFYG